MGSVAATPTRLSEVEALLASEALSPEIADRAAALVEANLHPIDDIRSTADYRRHVAGRVVRRLILDRGLFAARRRQPGGHDQRHGCAHHQW